MRQTYVIGGEGSVFQRWPEKGYLKLLVYGEIGTLKTRRVLGQLPGPRAVFDLEAGASDYGDLIDRDRDFYVLTKSHRTVSQGLAEIGRLPPGTIGTVIIDPITVVWASIKQGHIARMMAKGWYWRNGEKTPINDVEEVPFDIGVWGKLKMTYGDILSTLLAGPYHVAMIARGKDKIDATNGKIVGYVAEAEKTTWSLAKTVIQTRKSYDLVEKDRTGTFAEGKHTERLDFAKFLANVGTATHAIQTDSEAAQRDAGFEAPKPYHWPDVDRDWFTAELKKLGAEPGPFTEWFVDVMKGGDPPCSRNRVRLQAILAKLQAPESAGLYAYKTWLGPVGEEVVLDEAAPEEKPADTEGLYRAIEALEAECAGHDGLRKECADVCGITGVELRTITDVQALDEYREELADRLESVRTA